MTQKQTAGNLFVRPKRHWGAKRIIIHIAVFTLVGTFILSAGIFGRVTLKGRADEYLVSTRVDTLHLDGMDAIKSAMQSVVDDAAVRRAVDQAATSRKRTLKTTIIRMIAQGEEDAAVLQAVADAMLTAAQDRIEDHGAYLAVEKALGEQLDGIKASISELSNERLPQITLTDVRKALSVTTQYYPFMFYNVALITAGSALLLAAAVLLYIWIRFDEENKRRVAEWLEPMDYLAPFMVGILLFTLYPVVRVVVMSFQERFRLDGSYTGWGIGNYEYVLKGIEGTSNYFVQGVRNTVLYVLYTVPASTALAIVIAYLLNQKLRLSALFQTAYFLPMVTSITAVGLVWRWIFNRDFGVLNALLMLFGMDKINWLQEAANSLMVMVIFGIWNTLPFTIILLLSGLQNIDEAYYTVARVDGAKALRIFRRITVPLLAPTIGLVLTINSISAFKVFAEVTVLFNGSPGPAYNMYTVVYYIYEMMHQRLELGRAAAAAIVLFVFIFLFTVAQRYIQRKWNYV
ncbi:MAG: sugar ABC transporter permease [Eubacteriales bacterium]|nr:sugar ABC transporter permease [Eubacteriales bacterium]